MAVVFQVVMEVGEEGNAKDAEGEGRYKKDYWLPGAVGSSTEYRKQIRTEDKSHVAAWRM
jgi:hypothetical protein